MEYLKGKINDLETNIKSKSIRELYRGINEFKKGYHPRINIIKDKIGHLLADSQNVLNRWKNFFNQMINIHGVHNVRQEDIQTTEPLVPEPSLVEVEIAIGKLKSINPRVLIRFRPNSSKQGVKFYVLRYTDLFVLYGIRRKCHNSGRNLLFY
jgi:hypothetical protein